MFTSTAARLITPTTTTRAMTAVLNNDPAVSIDMNPRTKYETSAIPAKRENDETKNINNDWLLLRSHPYLKDRIESVKKEIELIKTKY